MLTLAEKAAHVVFPRLGSNMVPPVQVEEDLQRFKDLLKTHPFGGLVLFNGHAQTTPDALSELQSSAKSPLLVGSDIERGAGQQFTGATLFPHARAVGHAGIKATQAFAQIMAREALACGVHIAFAPVADVNLDPKNPIIGIRSFGTTAPLVSDHVQTFIHHCQASGLHATAKHFPGHGNTDTDSHEKLPIVQSSMDELSMHDLAPFKTAISANVSLMMTGHVAYPALDDSLAPATLSQPILTQLLRKKLLFDGPIISDSLIMKGIWTLDLSLEDSVARIIQAGVDILLDPPEPAACVEAIIKAVESGKISESQLDLSIARIQSLRDDFTERFGKEVFVNPFKASPKHCIGSALHTDTAENIAREAIKNLGTNPSKPSLILNKTTLALLVMPFKTHLDPDEQPLGTLLHSQIPNLHYFEIDHTSSQDYLDVIKHFHQMADTVLLFVVSKPAAWRAFGLPDSIKSYLNQLSKPASTLTIAMGDPGILHELPPSAHMMCSYSDTETTQRAVARWLKDL